MDATRSKHTLEIKLTLDDLSLLDSRSIKKPIIFSSEGKLTQLKPLELRIGRTREDRSLELNFEHGITFETAKAYTLTISRVSYGKLYYARISVSSRDYPGITITLYPI